MKTLHILGCLLIAAAPALAQDASHTFNYGDNDFGGSVKMTVDADYQSQSLLQKSGSLGATMTARIRMSGVEHEAVYVAGDVDAAFQGSYKNGRLGFGCALSVSTSVRIGGYTVFSRTRTDTSEIGSHLAPANVYGGSGVTDSYTLGPFTLTLSGNATASFDLSLRPTVNLFPPSIGLALDGKGPVNGSYGLAVGLFGLDAGVSSIIDLADPIVTFEVHTNFVTSGATLSWIIDKIYVTISAYVRGFGVNLSGTLKNLEFAGSRGSQNFLF